MNYPRNIPGVGVGFPMPFSQDRADVKSIMLMLADVQQSVRNWGTAIGSVQNSAAATRADMGPLLECMSVIEQRLAKLAQLDRLSTIEQRLTEVEEKLPYIDPKLAGLAERLVQCTDTLMYFQGRMEFEKHDIDQQLARMYPEEQQPPPYHEVRHRRSQSI